MLHKKAKLLFSFLEALYPYFGTLVYFLIGMETVTYLGFVRQLIFFDSRFFLVLFILLNLFQQIYTLLYQLETNSSPLKQIFIYLNYLLLPVTLFSYYTFLVLEATHYDNFVFSHTHIQPQIFQYFLWVNSFVVVSDFLFRKKSLLLIESGFKSYRSYLVTKTKEPSLSFVQVLSSLIFFTWVIFTLIQNAISTSSIIVKNYSFILRNPVASYEEKMIYNWGTFFKYMEFVKANTPENATIIIPPAQNHWLTSGNVVLVRYFLFPRVVINLVETNSAETLYTLPDIQADYITLVGGEWADKTTPFGWPKTDIAVDEILYFDPNTNTTDRKKVELYKAEDHQFQKLFGLLTLKKDQ